jgi:hypothetical protein
MRPYKIHKKRSQANRRKIIFIVLGAVLAAGLLFVVLGNGRTTNSATPNEKTNPGASTGINYDPPSDEDKQATQDYKDDIIEEQQRQQSAGNSSNNNSSGTSKKTVKPVIASAGDGDIRGIIAGVVENSGTCTATFTKTGQATVTRSAAASANAQNTICTVVYTGSPVGPGWKAMITYSSTNAEGTSDAVDIP